MKEIERQVRLLYNKLGVSDRKELRAVYQVPSDVSEVFAALDRARPMLSRGFRSHGVSQVEYDVDFVDPLDVSVWLCTQTDDERDQLRSLATLLEVVRSELTAAGLPSAKVATAAVVVQSQETVDRDFKGSWFYAPGERSSHQVQISSRNPNRRVT